MNVIGYRCNICGFQGSFDKFPVFSIKNEDGDKDSTIYCGNEDCIGQDDDLQEIYEEKQ